MTLTLDAIWRRSPHNSFRGRLACFDPGETTGVALFTATDHIELKHANQLKTWPFNFAVSSFTNIIDEFVPDIIVFESYRVYNWKTEQHANSDVPTLQVIGCLKTLCIQKKIPYYQQSAQIAKQFVSDEKLEQWGLYHRGERHSRDAMRHGTYFLIFGPKNDT